MKKFLWAFIGAMCMLVIGGVALLVVYIQNNDRFFSGTTINSIDCTSKTVTQVETELLSTIEGGEIEITGRRGLEETFSFDDLGVTYSFGDQISDAFSDSRSLGNLFRSKDYSLDYAMEIDDKTIKNCMKSVLDSQTIIDSKDAKIVFSEKTGKYKIKKEVYGNYFNIEDAAELVKKSLQEGESRE